MQKVRTVYPRVLGNEKAIPLILMAPFALAILFGFLGQLMLAYAADAPALSDSIMALFLAVKDKASTALILVAVFQVLKTNEALGVLGKIGLSGNTLRIVIALITVGGYVVEAYSRSGNLGAAAIEGLFTSGGAMLLFQAFKKEVVQTVEQKAPEAVAAVAMAGIPTKRNRA